MSRILIVLGLVILLTGLLWPLFGALGLGRLPGDIIVQRDNTTFYFPLVTSIVISIALTVVLNLAFWLMDR
jgi:multisubunit Na+/H+ antiporter MnhG subunit